MGFRVWGKLESHSPVFLFKQYTLTLETNLHSDWRLGATCLDYELSSVGWLGGLEICLRGTKCHDRIYVEPEGN